MIAPRYLPRLSADLSAWDLFAPATEEDLDLAMRRMLPRLASVPWPLSRTEKVTVARLQREWGNPAKLPASEVRLGLLCLALRHLLDAMSVECHVRFGERWFKAADGTRWIGRPAPEWAGIGERVDGDWFDVSTCPTADEVDRFARWAEQTLLRYARKALREMAPDVLDDGLAWLKSGEDILDQAEAITVSLTPESDGSEPQLCGEPLEEGEEAEYWERRFYQALRGLGQLLTRARYMALLSCFERIYSHRSGKARARRARLSDRDFEWIKRNVQKIEERQRSETTPLVLNALAALREMAAGDAPPPNLESVIRRHTRNLRTRRVRAR